MEALKELILKMADDAFIYGHRNSEWTGLGPTLEEDISMSSIAQDKVGHAWNLYKLLHEHFDENDADMLAFTREENLFKCCQLVEIYTQDYAFALMRHFLFDHAEYLRYTALTDSAFTPLAQLAGKVKGEIKYHTLHADTWIKKLSTATEQSAARMQSALNETWPLALGIFEPGIDEKQLTGGSLFIGEDVLLAQWKNTVSPILEQASLTIPAEENAILGGRKGYHSEDLNPLLLEMREVYSTEPEGTIW